MSERTEERTARRPAVEVVALALGLALLTAFLLRTIGLSSDSILEADGWAGPVLGVTFAVTLLTTLRIEMRGNAVLLSLSEIPLVFAALYLAPVEGVLARVVASAVVLGVIRRSAAPKLVFNLALFAFETAAVFWLTRQLLPEGADDGVRTVAAVTGSVMAVEVIGTVLVAVAVSRFGGDAIRRIAENLQRAWVLAVNVAMAGALLSLFLLSPMLAVFSIVPVGALWFMMKQHNSLAQELSDLNAVHGFAGRIGRTLDLDEICQAAVDESARLLRCRMGMLVLHEPSHTDRIFTTDGFPAAPVRPGVADWASMTEPSKATSTNGAALVEAGFAGWERCGDVMIASVDDGVDSIGLLVLAREPRAETPFNDGDATRTQNLADQLASGLRKGILHRRIEHEALHDTLTGLPNRLSLQRHLADATQLALDDEVTYVMMMDLDRFKEVNDTLGHHAGDELLIEFARRMSAQLGERDMLARLAGDEFAAVVNARDDAEIAELGRRCVAAGAEPLTLDGLSIVITASIGIAPLRADADDPEIALRQADIAMYNCKARHSGVELFRSEYDRRTPARLSMLGDLRHALDERHLDLEFQPKLDLASGLVIGAEALVRWTHDVRGVVAPTEFVRVAEDTGLIKRLTDMMLTQGIKEIRALHDRGHHLSLSVNLSTHDLLDANLSTRVAGYLADYDVDAASLTLEITESSLLVEAPRSRATIHELHEMGVRMSIDDFGTGYSSLSYLRQLPVSELKVDRSFIATMLVDSQDEVIVRSTVDLGHNLGLEVVAEGVENEQILDQLRAIGCDVAQGFTISRPLSPARFLAWLHTSNYSSRRVDPTRPEAWTLGSGN
ncbi:MAG: EAL domain-containing protein [Ilumatobacter sp.]